VNTFFRRIGRDVLVYASGDVVVRATGLITLPVYTRIFDPHRYGVLSFIWGAQALFTTVIALGGDSAYVRFFFEAKTHEARQQLTSTWLGFLALWSLGVVALLVPFSGLFSQASFNTRAHGLAVAFGLLTAPVLLGHIMVGQVLRNQFQTRLFTVLNVSTMLLATAGGLVGGALLDLGIDGVLGGMLVGYLAMLPVRLWSARSMFRRAFSSRLLRETLRFGLPLVPASIAIWIFELSDRFVLAKLSTLDEVGFYSVAASVTSVLGLGVTAVGLAWTPHAVSLYESAREDASRLIGRMGTLLLVAFGLIAVIVSVFAHQLVSIVAGPGYSRAELAVGPLALAFVAYASTQVTATGISLMKKTKYIVVITWAAALLNVALNVALVPVGGMVASAWATLASYILLTLAYLGVSQRLWRVQYETRKAVAVSVLTLAFVGLAPVLPTLAPALAVLIGMVYVGCYVGLLLALKVIDLGDIAKLSSLVRRPDSDAGTGIDSQVRE
jgi:O-antigen/teichoic acid export membrane protein